MGVIWDPHSRATTLSLWRPPNWGLLGISFSLSKVKEISEASGQLDGTS